MRYGFKAKRLYINVSNSEVLEFKMTHNLKLLNPLIALWNVSG